MVGPLVVASVAWYIAFLGLTYLGPGDQRFWFLVAWPYACLLAIQKFVGAPGLAAFIAAWIVGLALVVGFAGVLQKWSLFTRHRRLAIITSVLAWYVPLGVVTLLAIGAAHLFGWPYGE